MGWIIIKMENDQIRKKVYMQTHSSSLINTKPSLCPQWISQSQLSLTSSYEFSCYNIETQTMQMLSRSQGEAEVLLISFKADANELLHQRYYIYKDKQSFFLVHHPEQPSSHPLLLFRRDLDHKNQIVQKFLDYIIRNQDQPIFSNSTLINRTQQLIDDIHEEQTQEHKEYQYDLESISSLQVIYECNFALLLVEMKKINGVMLLNINKAQRETQREYRCVFTTVDFEKCEPTLTEEDISASKVIYLFPQRLLQIHRTSDITQFVFLTECHILLVKINYELMELCILHKLKTTRARSRVISVGVSRAGEEEYIIGLVEANRPISMKALNSKTKRIMKLFKIQDRKIVDIKTQSHYQNCPKYENQQGRTLKFLDESEKTLNNIKFSSNVVQSHYEISDSEEQGLDFHNNIIMNVFNSMLNEQGRTHQNVLIDKQALFNDSSEPQQTARTSPEKPIRQIAGIIANRNVIVAWEKEQSVLHLCRVLTPKEIEQRHQKEKEVQSSKNANKILLKEKEMKDIYAQLMGNAVPPKQQTLLDLESRIQYIRRVEIDLSCCKISSVSLSPNNYNLLVVGSSGLQSREALSYWVFQLQLFTQLANPDANMFVKPIRHIYKNKPTQHIATSLVRQMPIFLTGNLVHTLDCELIEGALSFDIHPYHLFLAVSFGFTTKVYALEGTERLSSLHTINLQGIKHVRYSPLGNHLCLLSSKSIRILDAYSFMLKFTIHQKYSNFCKCSFSANGLQLHTLSQNHTACVYNCFDYTRTDTIRPLSTTPDSKPLSIASFSKHMQYCLVLENGSMLVRYRQEAVVLNHESSYRYLDNERITAVEIDEKNGILFVGCGSGKLRAHLWPLKQQQTFDTYSQIRIGFSNITSLTLSNLNYFLYVGCGNGNTSKVKFLIDRDRGNIQAAQTPLFTQSNLKYINMSGNSNIQKVYKFVLANASSINQELPQKLRLEYKLSEVINKLNEEMHKLKAEVKEQIEQKIKLSTRRFDINLYHHLNKMITTKLSTQYTDEQDTNHRDIEQIRERNNRELKEILAQQNALVKEKSILISNNVAERNRINQENATQMAEFIKNQQEELERIDKKVNYTERKTNCPDDPAYYLPNCPYDYSEEKARLTLELQNENRQYYELRKECAYKQTAIRGMNSKKIKEESLQFKFQLQTNEMRKKQEYSRGVVGKLKVEIEEAEQKVHLMQAQASVIKGNAQFKKIANVEEMNDACSYKIWVKEKTEKEIHELCEHLRFLEDFLEGKSGEMVDLITNKADRQEQITTLQQQAAARKHTLKLSKLALLDSKNKTAKISKTDCRALLSASLTPREQDHSPRPLHKAHSSRQMVKSNKDVSLFNSIMQKQMNFLKTTMKIHKRKLKNFGKQNGQLLTEFQKLKYENKNLMQQQQIDSRIIKSLKKQLSNQEGAASRKNIDVQLVKTSFQKYLHNKHTKNTCGSKYKTVANTPTRRLSPAAIE